MAPCWWYKKRVVYNTMSVGIISFSANLWSANAHHQWGELSLHSRQYRYEKNRCHFEPIVSINKLFWTGLQKTVTLSGHFRTVLRIFCEICALSAHHETVCSTKPSQLGVTYHSRCLPFTFEISNFQLFTKKKKKKKIPQYQFFSATSKVFWE